MTISLRIRQISIVVSALILFTAQAGAVDYITENWDTGSPPACWPCKQDTCGETFNGWASATPYELGGTGHVEPAGQTSADYHSSPNSFLQQKQVSTTDGCNILQDISGAPSTIYLSFWLNLTTDFNADLTGSGLLHWIFTNSALSGTGFRLNLVSNGYDDTDCPVGYLCMLPEGDGGGAGDQWWSSNASPAWDSGAVNFKNYIGSWTFFEYKMEISGSSIILTEWINGVNTRGPSTGPGQGSPSTYFDQLIISDYENAGSSNTLRYYIDDVRVTSDYVEYSAGDTTPPTFSSAATNSVAFTLNFSEDVVTTGYDSGDCVVTGSSTGAHSITSFSGSGSSRTATLASGIEYGETATLSCTLSTDDIEDTAGNDMVTFGPESVTNNTPLTGFKNIGSSLIGCKIE